MSIWAPYKMEEQGRPIDLTRSRAVKQERISPSPRIASSERSVSQYSHYLPPTPSPPHTVPVQQLSPPEHQSYRPLQPMAGPTYFHQLPSPPIDNSSMDPLSPVAGTSKVKARTSEAEKPDLEFEAFRAAMLEARLAQNGGALTVTNPRMRRAVRRSSEVSDDADYTERRARNNAAAKRSRDSRKQREAELAIRVVYLENQNRQLQKIVDAGMKQCDCVYRR